MSLPWQPGSAEPGCDPFGDHDDAPADAGARQVSILAPANRRLVCRQGTRTHQEDDMDIPPVVSEPEWLTARTQLLAKEKEVTRAKDAVDAARAELPMTEVTKEYTFTGPAGPAGLGELFEGRRQLITYHFM